jgi:3-oxoacyl-[acyl-carrier protein] reductase
MRFEGRVALVTGASRGIGKATAIKLAQEGADVAVHYVRSAEQAEAVCKQLRELGRRAAAVQAHIADRPAVNKMVAKAVSELGPIDLLVNNAGDVGDMDFDELTPEHWDRVLAINLTGPFNVIWAVKDSMIQRRFGRIVNVSSIAALAVRPNQLPYATAKAGVISLTKSCCGPFAQHNIRINAVAPGAISTDMLREVSPEMVEHLRSTTPLGRLGEPQEMANVIAFLLSEESSYMTGSTVIASGGRILIP